MPDPGETIREIKRLAGELTKVSDEDQLETLVALKEKIKIVSSLVEQLDRNRSRA